MGNTQYPNSRFLARFFMVSSLRSTTMILLTISLLSGILFAALAPLLHRWLKQRAALLALFPAAIFVQLCLAIPEIAAGQVWQSSLAWVPSLGLTLTFTLDGLGLVMALLISGIGALVIVYGEAYLHGHPYLERFYSLVILFMTAMLGVVLSGNALLLFVFWELTSISSFFLIGFEHSKPAARAAAWQALLVTGSGGLAMMAGFALLGSISGSFEISRWVEMSGGILQHPLAPAAFLLVLAGACTKSAQFPFHFWLPNAMEAPTPVSAYLHSATMVKAGVYLLARLCAGLGRAGAVADAVDRHRADHSGGRGAAGAGADGSEAPAGLYHRGGAGSTGLLPGSGHAPGSEDGSGFPDHPRAVQRRVIPGGGWSGSRHGHRAIFRVLGAAGGQCPSPAAAAGWRRFLWRASRRCWASLPKSWSTKSTLECGLCHRVDRAGGDCQRGHGNSGRLGGLFAVLGQTRPR